MTPELEDRILVWWYSETDAYTQEHCDWFAPASFGHLHFTVAEFITSHLDEFYSGFSEWFSLAEYPDVLEQLEEPEVAVFLKAAGVSDGTDFESIQDYDCFSGLCAVIRHRLNQRSPDQLKLAAELFNWTIDCGLDLCDTTCHAVVKVGSAADVVPSVLERVLDGLPSDVEKWDVALHIPLQDSDNRILLLAPMLAMLADTVRSPDWVQNRLALRLSLWVVEVYKKQLETGSAQH